MDGVHDLGGVNGFGPVQREENEPVFHEDWEPIGYALISLRMYLQLLHLYDPDRFPANEPTSKGMHPVE